jgi:hypothetical protein
MTAIISGSSPSITFSDSTTQATAAASAMTLISTQTATSGATTLSWTGLSGYDTYLIIYNSSWSSYGTPGIEVGYGSTPTWITSGYGYNTSSFSGASFYSGAYNPNVTNFYIDGGSFGSGNTQNGTCYIQRCLQTSGKVQFLSCFNSDSAGVIGFTDGGLTISAQTTAIRINVTGSGKFSLYGISS